MKTEPKPRWMFELWAASLGDMACAADRELPMPPWRRALWAIRGRIVTILLAQWRWTRD